MSGFKHSKTFEMTKLSIQKINNEGELISVVENLVVTHTDT